MHIDQIELVLLLDRSGEATIDGAPIRIQGDTNSFAVACSQHCLLIGAMSLLSQSKSDEFGRHNLTSQRGTHSAPCSFNDVIEVFGPDIVKLRLIDMDAVEFDDKNQFGIPRTDRPALPSR